MMCGFIHGALLPTLTLKKYESMPEVQSVSLIWRVERYSALLEFFWLEKVINDSSPSATVLIFKLML